MTGMDTIYNLLPLVSDKEVFLLLKDALLEYENNQTNENFEILAFQCHLILYKQMLKMEEATEATKTLKKKIKLTEKAFHLLSNKS